jgi:hypothetical protein
MNYLVPGCTSPLDLLLLQIGFAPRASAAWHKPHHPKRSYPACFGCQQNQRIEHTVRSTCDKVNGQRLFWTVTIQHPVSRKGIRVGWNEGPTAALSTSDRVLLFPRSASDEKTAPVAAPPLGPFFLYDKLDPP